MDMENPQSPSHIVGIGASAGGLEALQTLFTNMPLNLGVAFIVVQHLSPDFESVMDELLAKVTRMPITHIKDGLEIEANTVYLNTPRTNVLLGDGRFIINQNSAEHEPRMPIDAFFRSLAEDQQERTIAIVLSGTGSDGSRGIRAVKEAGGIVIVQDPTEAKFDGMPNSSLNTGLADLEEETKEIPKKLRSYINHPLVTNKSNSLRTRPDHDQESLDEIFLILRDYTNIDFSEYKPSTIARRIERRMTINQMDSLKDYHVLLMSTPNELQILSKDLLIGVTEFFRDTEAFDTLRNEALPEIIKSTAPNETIRVWIAGCSTGEEAYSIAIALDKCMKSLGQRRTIKIFATDVDSSAITEAGLGVFSAQSVSDLDPDIVSEYFDPEGDQFVIAPKIRKMIIFAVHNLIKDAPFSGIHLVTCRNVLIYFQQNVQRRVLSSLQFSLLQNGYMFLGSSESISEFQASFNTIHERYKIFKKFDNIKLSLPSLVKDNLEGARFRASKAPSVSVLLKAHRGVERDVSYKPVVNKLFERFIPSTIVVDDQLNVIHIYGDVSNFTRKHQAGQFSSNVGHILNEDLSVTVLTAIHSAFENKADVLYENVVINKNSEPSLINVHAICVDAEYASDRHVIVSFQDCNTETKPAISVVPYDEAGQNKQRIIDLETQLKRKQEHLRVTVEELETTNEELQASNEELMAANEELQSTNEELQSVNEELYTVNNEFQQKIDEITQMNMDLDNLIQSSQIGMIFLDSSLTIRNFTSTVENFINVLPSDIGRPFHHISHKLHYIELLNDISHVIEDKNPRWHETVSKDGTDLLVKINPYYDTQREVKGCVISLTDISEIKGLRNNLSKTRLTLDTMLKASDIETSEDSIDILIFDDDEGDIELISRLISQIPNQHYSVHKASTQAQALHILTSENIQVCMVDYLLGRNTATEFIAELNQDLREKVAFILITNHMTDEVDIDALNQGVLNCLAKNELTPALIKHVTRSTHRAHLALKKAG